MISYTYVPLLGLLPRLLRDLFGIIFKGFLVHMTATAVVKLFFRKMFDVIAVVHSLLLLFLCLSEIFHLLFTLLHYQI